MLKLTVETFLHPLEFVFHEGKVPFFASRFLDQTGVPFSFQALFSWVQLTFKVNEESCEFFQKTSFSKTTFCTNP